MQGFGLLGHHFDLCGALLSFPFSMKMIPAAVVTVFLLGSLYVGITVIEVRADSSNTEKRDNINNNNNSMNYILHNETERTGEKERVGKYSEVLRPKIVQPFPRNFFYPSVLVALCFPYKFLTNPKARAPTGMEKSFKINAKIIYLTPQRHFHFEQFGRVSVSSQFHPPNARIN